MNDAWRGTDRWGRRSNRGLPIQLGEVATYDNRSPRLGMLVALLASAAFWVPATVALLVWAGR